jgi:hypothetical protein
MTRDQKICWELDKLYYNCSDPRSDGYTAFGYKQDLLKIKYHLNKLLHKCPTFVGETEFVDKLEKDFAWELLKK